MVFLYLERKYQNYREAQDYRTIVTEPGAVATAFK
jgi:hypothetical protein